ncbi:hypothetical protein ACFV8Z_16845 [Streptomyces sp. NPDC059837]|nr:hypothetical protein [Streptomyces sp. NBC_01764]MCX4403594.1 hypothetical protein [Streptomyces sp. NBC_01764]
MVLHQGTGSEHGARLPVDFGEAAAAESFDNSLFDNSFHGL